MASYRFTKNNVLQIVEKKKSPNIQNVFLTGFKTCLLTGLLSGRNSYKVALQYVTMTHDALGIRYSILHMNFHNIVHLSHTFCHLLIHVFLHLLMHAQSELKSLMVITSTLRQP